MQAFGSIVAPAFAQCETPNSDECSTLADIAAELTDFEAQSDGATLSYELTDIVATSDRVTAVATLTALNFAYSFDGCDVWDRLVASKIVVFTLSSTKKIVKVQTSGLLQPSAADSVCAFKK